MYKQFIKKFFIVIGIIQILIIYVLPSFFTVVYGKPPGEVGYNEWNDIPEPYGSLFYYMGWQMITDTESDDWQLISAANIDYNDDSNYDDGGYGLIDGCYVIACTHSKKGGIAVIGDYIDFELDNGVVINCIMGDEKSSKDENWTVWGHTNGLNVVEFIVDYRIWYKDAPKLHDAPGDGDSSLDKILKGRRVARYIRKGNYLKGDRLGGTVAKANTSSETDLTDFWGALKAIFGGLWDAVCVEFENTFSERNDITVRYDLNDKDDVGSTTTTNNNAGTRNGVVQYYQDDYADVPYGIPGKTIASSGCGPTALAMVVATLTGQTITPKDIVDWSGSKYYVVGEGTAWAIFPAAAENWNLQCKETNNINDVVQALKEGKLVISSQDPGLFTGQGHFIVLTTIDANGGISINDPNKSNAVSKEHNGVKGYNNTTFTAKEIDQDAKNYWIYWK